MNYQDELRAKLDAVRPTEEKRVSRVDVSTIQQQILDELDTDFNFSQYDLQESDILRAIKIQTILQSYPRSFEEGAALQLFFILSRIDIIMPQDLFDYLDLPLTRFKKIVNALFQDKLLIKNSLGELELTLEGKSLATRIGVDIFL